ncbi:hypothetical protein VKT23_017718 [Stygiomarasmius scandens]|uniref:Uncharacterized protein n=1 Tax=Marasmiellus scandens TaxID=2682957 RepID=A0ABR1IVD6_9AGAR
MFVRESDPHVRQVMMSGPIRSEMVILNRNVAGFELARRAVETNPGLNIYIEGLKALTAQGMGAKAMRRSVMVMMRSGILPIPGYTPFPTNSDPEDLFRRLLMGYTSIVPGELPLARYVYLVGYILSEFVTGIMGVLQERTAGGSSPEPNSPMPEESINQQLTTLTLGETSREQTSNPPPTTTNMQASVMFTGWEGLPEETVEMGKLSSSEEESSDGWTTTSDSSLGSGTSSPSYSPRSTSSSSAASSDTSSDEGDGEPSTASALALYVSPTPRYSISPLSSPSLLQLNNTPAISSGSTIDSILAEDGHELTSPTMQHREEIAMERKNRRPSPFNAKAAIEDSGYQGKNSRSG